MQLLDFQLHVAKWLFHNGVIEEHQTSPLATKGKDRVQLDAAASSSLRNGKARPAPRPGVALCAGRERPCGGRIARTAQRRAPQRVNCTVGAAPPGTARVPDAQPARVRAGPALSAPGPLGRTVSPGPLRHRAHLRVGCAHPVPRSQGMHALLVSVYEGAGLPFPVQASSLNSGEDAAGRLANWNALLPQMQKTFAVTLTADEKALLIAGHPEVLEHVVEMVYTRGSANHHDTVRQLANAGKKKKWQQAVTNDNISHAIVMTTQAAGVYACIMASLLSVFVPQWCPGNARVPEEHVCTTYGARLAAARHCRTR
jgi:hypothetical protein